MFVRFPHGQSRIRRNLKFRKYQCDGGAGITVGAEKSDVPASGRGLAGKVCRLLAVNKQDPLGSGYLNLHFVYAAGFQVNDLLEVNWRDDRLPSICYQSLDLNFAVAVDSGGVKIRIVFRPE